MATINYNTGLVLEGGGMRSVFTSGVLDAFMKHALWFRYVVAVSAGACNGLSYISRQPRRARFSNIDMLDKYEYIGLRHLVSQGCIFDPELLYDKFPNKIIPFDWYTYSHNPAVFEMVTTNCVTGRAEYLTDKTDKVRMTAICQASSSLPYVSNVVMVDGRPMLDGGIVDSIPVERAMATGHPFNVVVATRNYGYRNDGKDIKIPSFIYKDYPRLRVALSHRIEVYNRQLQLIEDLEAEGKIVCIRPQRPLEVDRISRDMVKLERLYEEGFALGEAFALKVAAERK